jgi:hypothetical protein
MATKTKPIPDGYRRVTPALVVQGGVKALEFYADVFDATERWRFPGPGGTIAHAEIEIGDSVIIVEDESPERGSKAPPTSGVDGSPSSLFIYVGGCGRGGCTSGEARRHASAFARRSVLRRPRRLHRGPVRSWMDGRHSCGGRRAGGADATDGGDADTALVDPTARLQRKDPTWEESP